MFRHFFIYSFFLLLKWHVWTSVLSKTMISHVWHVASVTEWLTVTFSEHFKTGLTRILGLCNANSSSLITTGFISCNIWSYLAHFPASALKLSLKKFLIYFPKKNLEKVSYILSKEVFLTFRKRNCSYISGKVYSKLWQSETFLYFGKVIFRILV